MTRGQHSWSLGIVHGRRTVDLEHKTAADGTNESMLVCVAVECDRIHGPSEFASVLLYQHHKIPSSIYGRGKLTIWL